MSIWRDIRDDIRFVLDRDPAALNPFEVVFLYPGFQAREIHRLAHTLWCAGVPFLPRAISHLTRMFTGIEIHPGATIHRRCFIDHGMGVVIGETAVIGDCCHLLQGVTLGGTSTKRTKRHPTLGEKVTVGAGAHIIGAVTIGNGAKIGAGSVVVGNVPEYATVVGVPGHVRLLLRPRRRHHPAPARPRTRPPRDPGAARVRARIGAQPPRRNQR